MISKIRAPWLRACVLALTCTLGTAALAGRAGDVVPGELLLKLRSTAALTPLLQKYQLTLVSAFGARPIYRVKVIGAIDAKTALAGLQAELDVLIAEPNLVQRPPEAAKNNVWAIGTQTGYVAQWAWTSLRLDDAHLLATGAGVRVAVLDTGVDRLHPALVSHLDPGYDFVDGDSDPSEQGTRLDPAFGHGTHVAGIVAQIAPDARIIPLRVLDPQGRGDTWALGEALLRAVDPDGNPATDDGAHVINLSMGGVTRTRLLDAVAQLAECGTADATDPVTEQSDAGYNVDRERCSNSIGAVIVASAGNDGSNSLRIYPAAEGAYGLVSVAASRSDGRLAGFSNSGNWIDVAAPGDGITSTVPGGGYGTWSGTSMASPMVAGTAALVRQVAPTMRASEVKRCVVRMGGTVASGAMMALSPLQALQAAMARANCR
jgi:subtilisin family serine protease